MSRAAEIMGLNAPSDDEDQFYGSSDEEDGRSKQFSAAQSSDKDESNDEADPLQSEEDEEQKEIERKRLIQEEAQKAMRAIKKSGVVYLSTIPPYMKPVKVKQILERFGDVNRIYLSPEDPKVYHRRVKSGGNRKKKFTEGWAEFKNKKEAKLAVSALNGNPLGGKKGSFYYDDIINIKYLPKFKWHDLTEQIALETQERQEKLKAEIAQATKENRVFIDNVEQKERIDRQKRKAEEAGEDMVAREAKHSGNAHMRTFDQRPSKQAKRSKQQSAELSKVLSKVFWSSI